MQRTRGVTVIKRRGTDRLQIAFTYRGLECRELFSGPVTPENLIKAAKIRDLVIREIELGVFDYKTRFPKSSRALGLGATHSNPVFSQVVEDWLNGKERSIAHSTLVNYKKIIKKKILPYFGSRRIREITHRDIRQWIQFELTTSNKTTRNVVSVLRSIFEVALNNEQVEKSPFEKIKVDKLLPPLLPEDDGKFIDPFTEAEMVAIVEKAEEAAIRNLIMFLFDTGVRLSEAFGLRKKDVDLENGTVTIQRAVVLGKEKIPKTKAGRRKLKLLKGALRALQSQIELGPSKDDYIFWRPDTRQGWKNDGHFRQTFWKPLLARAGVRYRYPYQTRHTFGSRMVEAGASIPWVSRTLGHSTSEMTIRHYIRAKSEPTLPKVEIPDWSAQSE